MLVSVLGETSSPAVTSTSAKGQPVDRVGFGPSLEVHRLSRYTNPLRAARAPDPRFAKRANPGTV